VLVYLPITYKVQLIYVYIVFICFLFVLIKIKIIQIDYHSIHAKNKYA